MESKLKIIFLFLLGFDLSQSLVLPKQKCKIRDNICMITTMQSMLPDFVSGIPEYGIEVMDPFAMDDIAYNVSGFQFSLTGGVMKGMKNIVVDKFDLDLEKKTAQLTFHTDVSMKGHYTAEGTIFDQTIRGDGEIKVKLKNFQLALFYNFDIVNIDGKDHVKIKQYKFEFDVKDNAHYHLTNLFNGNKELSDAALNFANNNWHQFSLAFGGPLIDIVWKKTVRNMNKFFKHVALDDIVYF